MLTKDTMDLIAWGANILSTISTAAAVIVALWFGLKGERDAKAQALKRANLVAARISVSLDTVVQELRSLSADLAFTVEPAPPPDVILRENWKAITAYFEQHTFKVELDVLSALTELPKNCAHLIARAEDTLGHARQIVGRVGKGAIVMSERNEPVNERGLAVGQVRQLLDQAQDYLTIASRVCMEAAILSAPAPTGEELYGG
jgi:hypothetical protein